MIASRAGVLIITLISTFLCGVFAFRNDKFELSTWILVSFGLLFAHATNNLLNDYTDWKKGVDKDNYFRNRYGTHPMTVLTESEFLSFLIVTGLIALSFGLYLVYLKGIIIFYLVLSGSFFLLFYTYPLKYIGMVC